MDGAERSLGSGIATEKLPMLKIGPKEAHFKAPKQQKKEHEQGFLSGRPFAARIPHVAPTLADLTTDHVHPHPSKLSVAAFIDTTQPPSLSYTDKMSGASSRPMQGRGSGGTVPSPYASPFTSSHLPSDRPSAHAPEFVPPRRWPPTPTPTPTSAAPAPSAPTDMYANGGLRESARAEVAVLLGRAHPALAVPELVGAYYAVVPLEPGPRPAFGRAGGPHTLTYKAVSAARGTATALVRVVGPPPAGSVQIQRAGQAWRNVQHPALLCLKEVFTTRQFGAAAVAGSASRGVLPANEVVFAYEFASRADTLHNVFLGGMPPDHRFHPLAESTLWAIASQLLSALATVHANRLALRDALSTARVLVTGRNRVRVSCVGLSDAFDPQGADHVPATGPGGRHTNHDRATALQREDLANLGLLLATLALRIDPKLVRSGVMMCSDDIVVDALRRVCPYSEDFALLVGTLRSAARPGAQVTTTQVLNLVGPRMAMELGNVWTHCDALESKLFVEFDSSRMFRLMGLLGFVNERGDAGVEPQWSETGDRYLLKLFRDYVFHRVDAHGSPILDMAHVVECLSRLDVGSPEQVLLSSRDGASLLVATYEDLRRCLMQAVDELRGSRHGMPTR